MTYLNPTLEAYLTLYDLTRNEKLYLLEKKLRKKKMPAKKRAVKLMEAVMGEPTKKEELLKKTYDVFGKKEVSDKLLKAVSHNLIKVIGVKRAGVEGRAKRHAIVYVAEIADMLKAGASEEDVKNKLVKLNLPADAVDEVMDIVKSRASLPQRIWNKIVSIFNWIWEKVKNAFAREEKKAEAQKALKASDEKEKQAAFSRLWSYIKGIASNSYEYSKNHKLVVFFIALGILTLAAIIFEPVKKFLSKIMEKIVGFFKKSYEYVVTYLGSFVSWIKGLFSSRSEEEVVEALMVYNL